ncbi:MAG: GatB/YqeY domain-containing protein [Anaerolineaceae bacterium]|nr:GatB/YqeY domain-containing protein [Anaerolineaceae bacterium]
MNLKEKLQTELKEALRSGDNVRKNTIRMAMSSIKLAEVEKGSELDEQGFISIIQKEIKIRQEAIQDAQKAGRTDLLANNQDEVKILESFLPKQLSEDEIKEMTMSVIAEVQAVSPTDMGRVMKTLLPRVQGRAPNDQVSRIVRQLLTK